MAWPQYSRSLSSISTRGRFDFRPGTFDLELKSIHFFKRGLTSLIIPVLLLSFPEKSWQELLAMQDLMLLQVPHISKNQTDSKELETMVC